MLTALRIINRLLCLGIGCPMAEDVGDARESPIVRTTANG